MDVYGRTALHYGSLKNHVPVVQVLLLSNYTKLKTQDNNGDSPVDLAVISNSGATVVLLPFYGANLNSEAKQKLRFQALCGSVAALEMRYSTTDIVNPEEGSILQQLVWRGSVEAVSRVLDMIAARYVKYEPATEPLSLHVAAMNGFLEIMFLLFDSGIFKVQDTVTMGFTALHFAARYGQYITVQFLLNSGAEVDAINKLSKQHCTTRRRMGTTR